jgi:hypothetical protein
MLLNRLFGPPSAHGVQDWNGSWVGHVVTKANCRLVSRADSATEIYKAGWRCQHTVAGVCTQITTLSPKTQPATRVAYVACKPGRVAAHHLHMLIWTTNTPVPRKHADPQCESI